jgi:predicted TIM-barrel fold metal-dependent hydrolase
MHIRKAKREDVKVIIDAHAHIVSRRENCGKDPVTLFTPKEVVTYMDKCRVDKIIATSLQATYSGNEKEIIEGNREVSKYMKDYPHRILGACVVHPKFGKRALKELEFCIKELGMVKLGEICPGQHQGPLKYKGDSPTLYPLIEKCTELKIPFHLHSGNDYSNPFTIENLVKRFPEATFIMSHFGGIRFWKEGIEVASRYKNIYVDTSGLPFIVIGILEEAIKKVGVDRLIFGSDFVIDDPGSCIVRIEHTDLAAEEKEKIFSGNILKLIAKN